MIAWRWEPRYSYCRFRAPSERYESKEAASSTTSRKISMYDHDVQELHKTQSHISVPAVVRSRESPSSEFWEGGMNKKRYLVVAKICRGERQQL